MSADERLERLERRVEVLETLVRSLEAGPIRAPASAPPRSEKAYASRPWPTTNIARLRRSG